MPICGPRWNRPVIVTQTRCDTETILHAYEQYGADCVRSFRGMFAFAIWDQTTRNAVLRARPAGHQAFLLLLGRPAVRVRFRDQGAAGASGHLARASTNRCSPSIWPSATSAAKRRMFRGIRKLMPGHTLTLRSCDAEPAAGDQAAIGTFPRPPSSPKRSDDRSGSPNAARRLEDTVRTRLMSDVPLGMFLSGGVDSSAIAALIKRMTRDR